jgi:type II secretory pathway component GspD/PulD (secretin)
MIIPLRDSLRSIAVGLTLILAFAAWPVSQVQAAPVKVTGVALKEAGNELQVSIVATGPVRYQTRDIQPSWIVIDVQSARLGIPSGQLPVALGLVRRVRVGQFMEDVVRVVVELKQPSSWRLSTSPNGAAIVVGIRTQAKGHPLPAVVEVAQLPLPPAAPPASQPAPAAAAGALTDQTLINLDLRNADITDVISALAKMANINVVTDADVRGRVTVRLINVTFEDALRLVLEPNGLAYATVGPNLLIMRKEKLALHPVLRQYQVANMSASTFATTYLPVIKIAKEQAVVDEATNSILVVGSVEDHGKIADLLSRVDLPIERAVTRSIKLSYLDPAVFLDLLSVRLPDVTKSAKIDKASNSVVLTASVAQIEIIDALLQQVDTPLAQVLVEAMVLEVPTQFTNNLGVAWQQATPFTFNSTGGQLPCCPVVSITSPSLIVTLNTLITQNKSRLLANPRLAVRDGETATMNIGDKIPFQVINAQGVPSVVIIEAGVKLVVTPRVTSDGFVTVKMHPEVSTIKTPPGPNIPPTIATREADSSLTVKDGTPIILAGLIQKNEINTTVKVPLLGDIPILGWLFKSVSTDNTNNEVIFVITPHILQKAGS